MQFSLLKVWFYFHVTKSSLVQASNKRIFLSMRVIQLPSALVLKHIADCLEVSADYLLGDGEQTIKDTALFDNLSKLIL